jgi:hypothetical protein
MLRETDRDEAAAVDKRHGVSKEAIYGCGKKFGAFKASDVRRFKQLDGVICPDPPDQP